jgi:hypothetical protein
LDEETMAKQIELKGRVTEVYAGDPQTPHLGGRVQISGEGWRLDAQLPVEMFKRLKPGAAMMVSIAPE